MILLVLKFVTLIFVVVWFFNVLWKAFRYKVSSGFLCFIPFYAPYFVFKKSKEVFKNRFIYKIWAVLAVIELLAAIYLNLLQ